jgi:glycerophosphoryl diester phosphodiesterase
VLWTSLAVAAAIIGFALVQILSVPIDDDVEIVAHRGGAIAAPENTMAAVHRGIVDTTDWVEIDVQESADGVIVVAHDKDFMRASGVDTKVWEAPYDQLRKIDIGSWFAPEFAGEHPPTLEEVLLACKGKARVVIELKYYGHDQQLEQRVAEIVESTEMVSDVSIMSLKYAGVLKFKALRPDWSYGLLSAVSVGNLARLDVDFLAVNASQAKRSMIRSAHGRGKRVYVWTVNDPIQMSTMISRGVDAIITDDPARVRAVLDQRSELSAVERLLIELGASVGIIEGAEESSDESDA